ncbi:MAG: hypothetical protein KY464_02615 [Gemmatimonadetes bacterium]|nr:hypothetical protein [Gemmatimonadota bacterium]
MDRSHSDPPAIPASGFSLLRPAVPPRSGDAAATRAPAERSLGPFSAGRRAAEPPPPVAFAETAEQPASAGDAAPEELPWAVLDAPLWDDEPAAPASEAPLWAETPPASASSAPAPNVEAPDAPAPVGDFSSFLYEAEELTLGDEAEWLDFESSVDTPMAEDALEPLAEVAEPGQEPLVGEELIAPPEWEYGFDDTASAEAGETVAPGAQQEDEPVALAEVAAGEELPAPGPALGQLVDQRSPALEDVATRLERIAQSLRGRTPADLLAGTNDPLQLLIAGYALGLEAARASKDPKREEG